MHHPADEEEGEPNEEGVPPTGEGHDEGGGGAESGDAQGDAKDHGPDDEALGDLVGLADVVDVSGEGSSSDVRVATLDEGDAVSGDELVGDEGYAASGGEEEHETGIVLRSGEAGKVEEANDLGRLGHAAEGQAKGKDGGGTNGGEGLEDVRDVRRGHLFLLQCAAVVVVVVGELQFLLLLFAVGGRLLSLNVFLGLVLLGGRRGLLFLLIVVVGRVRGSRYRPNLHLVVVGVIILSLLGQLPFSDDIGDIDDGGHAEQGREEDAKSGSHLGLVQDPLLQTGGLVDAGKGRTAKAGGEEGHAHERAHGDDGSGTHPSDAADAVAGRAAVGALGAESGEEAADGHDPQGGVGEGVEDAPVGGVEVGEIDQELDGEEKRRHEGAFPTLLGRTDGVEGMGSEGSHQGGEGQDLTGSMQEKEGCKACFRRRSAQVENMRKKKKVRLGFAVQMQIWMGGLATRSMEFIVEPEICRNMLSRRNST